MRKTVGVRAGLTVDHLVTAGAGAHFNQLGGPGLFAALGARLIAGTEPYLFTHLPADEPGFESLFREMGINLDYSQPSKSALRLWILNSNEGRRIIETRSPQGIELEAAPGGRGPEVGLLPSAPQHLVLDAMLESSPLERPVGSPGLLIGIDPHQVPLREEGFDYLERVATPNAVLLPSRVQLGLLHEDPRQAARTIRERLQLPVVARLDREGMIVLTSDGEWIVKDAHVDVVETTGAGDASAAAIVAALAIGADLVTAAEFGVSAARLALSHWGHEGLLTEPLTQPLSGITSTREN